MAVFCGSLRIKELRRQQGRPNSTLAAADLLDSEISDYERRITETSRLIPSTSTDDQNHHRAWTTVLKAVFSFNKALNGKAKRKTTTTAAGLPPAKRRSSWIPGPHDRRWPVQGW